MCPSKFSHLKVRCEWAANGSPTDIEYHDNEWGVPVHGDRKLFEFLLLESAQAGLNWSLILKKREGYRKAFDNFDANIVACYDQRRIQQLLSNPSIIRNRLKIESAIRNARAFIKVQQNLGALIHIFGISSMENRNLTSGLTGCKFLQSTETSDKLSKDLKKRGFVFVGSTTCYSIMQAVGLVNDHTINCFRYKDLI